MRIDNMLHKDLKKMMTAKPPKGGMMMKPKKKLVDVLSEEEQRTFLSETIIPKLQKLMNLIRSSTPCNVRDKDFEDVSDMVRDMEKGRHPYQITPSDLKWCNTLYRKYWKLSL